MFSQRVSDLRSTYDVAILSESGRAARKATQGRRKSYGSDSGHLSKPNTSNNVDCNAKCKRNEQGKKMNYVNPLIRSTPVIFTDANGHTGKGQAHDRTDNITSIGPPGAERENTNGKLLREIL